MAWAGYLTDLFFRGGWLMYPLLACSVLALAVTLERACVFARRGGSIERFTQALRPLWTSGGESALRDHLRRQRHPLARLAEARLDTRDLAPATRAETLGRVASEELAVLERRLSWLALIGQLAPMIGLLGTVWGLVAAFQQVETLRGQVQPGDLAAGIWQALLTTVFGLVVALPTLAAHHLFARRVSALELHMQWLLAHLNAWEERAAAPAAQAPAAAQAQPAPVGDSSA